MIPVDSETNEEPKLKKKRKRKKLLRVTKYNNSLLISVTLGVKLIRGLAFRHPSYSESYLPGIPFIEIIYVL